MGRFLAIGLVTQISVDKLGLARTQLTPEQLQERIKAKLHYDPELYLLREQFYAHFDFIPSPVDPYHLFLLLKDVRRIIEV